MKTTVRVLFLLLMPLLFVINTSFIGLRSDKVEFVGYFGDEPLMLNKKYWCASKQDSISISTCRFYVSDFTIYEGTYAKERLEFKLIDLFDTTSNSLVMFYHSLGVNTEFRFKLGIDSTTNVSGVGSGDLDPTKGMYWSWQSGYINMKLEGNSKLCSKTKNEFQYHLGGYAAPNNALQTISLKIEDDKGFFKIHVDVQKLLEQVDLKLTPNIMSPSLNAVALSKHAAMMFALDK